MDAPLPSKPPPRQHQEPATKSKSKGGKKSMTLTQLNQQASEDDDDEEEEEEEEDQLESDEHRQKEDSLRSVSPIKQAQGISKKKIGRNGGGSGKRIREDSSEEEEEEKEPKEREEGESSEESEDETRRKKKGGSKKVKRSNSKSAKSSSSKKGGGGADKPMNPVEFSDDESSSTEDVKLRKKAVQSRKPGSKKQVFAPSTPKRSKAKAGKSKKRVEREYTTSNEEEEKGTGKGKGKKPTKRVRPQEQQEEKSDDSSKDDTTSKKKKSRASTASTISTRSAGTRSSARISRQYGEDTSEEEEELEDFEDGQVVYFEDCQRPTVILRLNVKLKLLHHAWIPGGGDESPDYVSEVLDEKRLTSTRPTLTWDGIRTKSEQAQFETMWERSKDEQWVKEFYRKLKGQIPPVEQDQKDLEKDNGRKKKVVKKVQEKKKKTKKVEVIEVSGSSSEEEEETSEEEEEGKKQRGKMIKKTVRKNDPSSDRGGTDDDEYEEEDSSGSEEGEREGIGRRGNSSREEGAGGGGGTGRRTTLSLPRNPLRKNRSERLAGKHFIELGLPPSVRKWTTEEADFYQRYLVFEVERWYPNAVLEVCEGEGCERKKDQLMNMDRATGFDFRKLCTICRRQAEGSFSNSKDLRSSVYEIGKGLKGGKYVQDDIRSFDWEEGEGNGRAEKNWRRLTKVAMDHDLETPIPEPPRELVCPECSKTLDWRKGDTVDIKVRDEIVRIGFSPCICIINSQIGRINRLARNRFNSDKKIRRNRGETEVAPGVSLDGFRASILSLVTTGGVMSGARFGRDEVEDFEEGCENFWSKARCWRCGVELSSGDEVERTHDLVSIDRLDSRLAYSDKDQTIVLSCLGCNLLQGDLDAAERERLDEALEGCRGDGAEIGDAVVRLQDLIRMARELEEDNGEGGKEEVIDEVGREIKQIKTFLDGTNWSKQEAESSWEAYGEGCTGRQRSRKSNGKMVGVTTTEGSKYENRQRWTGPIEDTAAANLDIVRPSWEAGGNVCSATGASGEAEDDSHNGLLALQIDRILDDEPYSEVNTFLLLGAVNIFESTLPAFRSSNSFMKMATTRPDIQAVWDSKGFRAAAMAYLRSMIPLRKTKGTPPPPSSPTSSTNDSAAGDDVEHSDSE